MKHQTKNRILSFFLAMVMLCTNAPFPVNSVSSVNPGNQAVTDQPEKGELIYDYDTLKITKDGFQISSLDLQSYEKIVISADGISSSASYQWQVEHPEKDGVWVNVYDGTQQTISVTLALVESVLRADGTAKLRCRAYTEDYAYLTNPVTVKLQACAETVVKDQPGKANAMPADVGTDDLPEFVTVTIRYNLHSWIENADGTFTNKQVTENVFTSYVATLKSDDSSGASFDTVVHCPTLVGFEPRLVSISVGGASRPVTEDDFDDKEDEVHISLSPIVADVVYVVEYHPANVSYKVQYFFQNIYDDLYVEDSKIQATVDGVGETGTRPSLSQVNKAIPGFTSLYYEPDLIAADGSTIFHVYYERNYYLMEFDCNGGYGTDTIYVRYGAHISVPNPVKAGWVFGVGGNGNGWDLVQTDQTDPPPLGTDPDGDGRYTGDGQYNLLPLTMPAYNSAYKAIWDKANTTYKVSYWIVHDNGTTSYLGGNVRDGLSGDVVSGEGDLHQPAGAICGEVNHVHTDDCWSCNQLSHEHHKHSINCYAGPMTKNGTVDKNSADYRVIQLANGNKENDDGVYLYFIQAYSDKYNGVYWPKLYIDGEYFTVRVGGYDSVNTTTKNNMVDGAALSNEVSLDANGTTYYTAKYKAKLSCIQEVCVTECNQHSHTQACYANTRHLTYVDQVKVTKPNGKQVTYKTDKDVILEGDGSTSIDVYYQYKKYTLKFYYAATVGGNDTDSDGINDSVFDSVRIVGGSTYYFGYHLGTNTDEDGSQLENMFYTHHTECDEVEQLPSLNATGTSRQYTKGGLKVDRDGDDDVDVTYHYISFQARYGDDISGMWPCGVFNSATRSNTSNASGWHGTEAFVSAWNGEHHVAYSRNGNETIKGLYEKLDGALLFHSDYTDSDEVSYLCFWENGAGGIQWSIPELYTYKIWIPCIDNKKENAPEGKETRYEDNIWYYLKGSYNTCDDSTVDQQTPPALAGYSLRVGKWAMHFASEAHTADGNSYYTITKTDHEVRYNKSTKHVTCGGWSYTKEMSVKTYEVEETNGTKQTYYIVYDPDTYNPDNPGGALNHNLYREAYTLDYYYEATPHKLSFWNHDGYLSNGTGSQVTYGTPLRKFFDGITVGGQEYDGANDMIAKPEYYPDTLEPGAYRFAGWFTSSTFEEETRVDWESMRMPDSDLMVYAKWEAIKRNIYFYLTYDDMNNHLKRIEENKVAGLPAPDPSQYTWATEINGESVTYPIIAPHGSILGSTYTLYPERWEDVDGNGKYDEGIDKRYTFVGWFYMDEDNKKRFAPDTMEIKKDLHLFAEWQSDIDTKYTVYYELAEETVINGTTYPEGYTVADTTVGHLTAGKTKTFAAKAKDQLKSEFSGVKLYPQTNSHSILMDYNHTANNFTFRYVADDAVWYRIRYVNKITGEDIYPQFEKLETVETVITAKFVPITGYIAEEYYIRKVLASDGSTGTADDIQKYNNEIIFYYTPDTEHGLYTIEYYTQTLSGGWYLAQSVVGSDDLFEADGVTPKKIKETIDPNKFGGFVYDHTNIINYQPVKVEVDGKETWEYVKQPPVAFTELNVEGTLTAGGLEIQVYYTRKTYDYIIKFVEYGAPDNVLGYGDPDSTAVFLVNPGLEKVYESEVEYTAPDSFKGQDGVTYNFYTDTAFQQLAKQSMTIRASDTHNVLIFYYKARETKILYEAVCKTAGAVDYGRVSLNHESAATLNGISGSNAIAGEGYRLVGWFTDPECRNPASPAWRYIPGNKTMPDQQNAEGTKLKPGALDDEKDQVTYYALFEPIVDDLTIKKDFTTIGHTTDDVFIFHIKGEGKLAHIDLYVTIQGDKSVVIKNLPVGEYTITEETRWSYQYTLDRAFLADGSLTNGQITIEKDEDNIITFVNQYDGSDWLGDENRVDNNFSAYNP